jgi:hypothetical protein
VTAAIDVVVVVEPTAEVDIDAITLELSLTHVPDVGADCSRLKLIALDEPSETATVLLYALYPGYTAVTL